MFRLSHRGGLVIHIELRLTMYWCNIEAEGPPMVATISLHCAHNGGTAWVQCVDSNDTIHNVGNPSSNNHCQPYLTSSNRYGGEFTQKDLSSNLPTIQPFRYIFSGHGCLAWVPDVSIFDSIVFIIPSAWDTILTPPGAQRQTLKK